MVREGKACLDPELSNLLSSRVNRHKVRAFGLFHSRDKIRTIEIFISSEFGPSGVAFVRFAQLLPNHQPFAPRHFVQDDHHFFGNVSGLWAAFDPGLN